MASAPKKVKYRTSFSKEWVNTYSFVGPCAISVPDYQHKFRCNVCNINLSCSAGGINDVKKHSETPTNQKYIKSVQGK